MIHTVAAITMFAQQCAPEIAAEAVVPLVVTESGGNDLSININKGPRVRAASIADGAALVRRYMAAGYTVDVGLAQVNSTNFVRLGVTVEQTFDPCTNLRLASSILRAGYGLAIQHYTGLDAISATYSLYNTGTLTRGFRNGYVGRIWSAASDMGTIQTPPPIPGSASASAPTARPASAKQGIAEASWVVGQIDSSAVQVFE